MLSFNIFRMEKSAKSEWSIINLDCIDCKNNFHETRIKLRQKVHRNKFSSTQALPARYNA